METRTITLATDDGPMDVYEAVPSTPNGAAVVVLQEAFGVNEHIEDVTRRFAEAGYHAVAPHLFHRAGGGTAPYDDFAKVLPLFEGLSDAAILTDVDAVVRHLPVSEAKVGVVGFCMGGRASFLVAAERWYGAAVGFYGGGIVTARRPQLPALAPRAYAMQTPWLGVFGDRDESIPVDDVESLRATLAEAPVDTEVVRYADADHGFHCDARPSFHPDAAADAWKRTLQWLERHLLG